MLRGRRGAEEEEAASKEAEDKGQHQASHHLGRGGRSWLLRERERGEMGEMEG
jgi:hypothetical protein